MTEQPMAEVSFRQIKITNGIELYINGELITGIRGGYSSFCLCENNGGPLLNLPIPSKGLEPIREKLDQFDGQFVAAFNLEDYEYPVITGYLNLTKSEHAIYVETIKETK